MGSLSCVLLPLDDRPINTSHVAALSGVGNITLKLPPETLIASHGDWNFEKLVSWLDFQMGWNEAAVISVDMFLYGGLIHSRTNRTSEAEAFARLEKLKELICKHDCRVYLSSVLLRLSITVSQQQPEIHWKNIFNFSVLKDKVSQGLATPDELQAVETQIPAALLAEYLYARKRNSDVNLALVELAEHCDYVLYGQEDCSPYGLHRVEKQTLVTRIGREMPSQQARIAVLTGADEMNAILLARAACDAWRVKHESLPMCFNGLDDATRAKVSLYEDVTVEQNIVAHLKPSPFYLVDKTDDDAVEKVSCLAFADESQPDLYFLQQQHKPLASTPDDNMLVAGEEDSVLDFSCSNGAHPQIIGLWLQKKVIPKSFSAWNTTGNRLGTLVAHLSLIAAAKQHHVFQPTASRHYTLMRLLDDYCYQSVVREKLQRVCEEKGYNPWALSEVAHHELEQLGFQLINEQIKKIGWHIQVSFKLKWRRLFEADIQIVDTKVDFPLVQKVVAYILRNDGKILVFEHDKKWSEAGIQVPAGTIEEDEDPVAAVIREAQEESGLTGLKVLRKIDDYTFFREWQQQFNRRQVFLLSAPAEVSESWEHKVTGDGSDKGMTFYFYWLSTDEAKQVLSGGLGSSLVKLDN